MAWWVLLILRMQNFNMAFFRVLSAGALTLTAATTTLACAGGAGDEGPEALENATHFTKDVSISDGFGFRENLEGEHTVSLRFIKSHPEQVLTFELWERAQVWSRRNDPLEAIRIEECDTRGTCVPFGMQPTLHWNDPHSRLTIFTAEHKPMIVADGSYYTLSFRTPRDYELRRVSVNPAGRRGKHDACTPGADSRSFDSCGAGLTCLPDPTNAHADICTENDGGEMAELEAPGNRRHSSALACGTFFSLPETEGVGPNDTMHFVVPREVLTRDVQIDGRFRHAHPTRANDRPVVTVRECDDRRCVTHRDVRWEGDGREYMGFSWDNPGPAFTDPDTYYVLDVRVPADWEARRVFFLANCQRGLGDQCDARGGCDGALTCGHRGDQNPATDAPVCLGN